MLNQISHNRNRKQRKQIFFKRTYKLSNFRIHITHSGKDCIIVTLCQRQYYQDQNTEREKRECMAIHSHGQFSSHLTEV